MTTATVTTDVRRAAIEADDAYSAELRRVFGKAAGGARYDARGTSTPELRRLSDAKLAADAAVIAATTAAAREGARLPRGTVRVRF